MLQLTDLNINQSTLLRYQLIEIIAYWEGRVTTRHLCSAFDLGRQQASRLIALYRDDIAPENLTYDSHIRGYIPTDQFNPKVTKGHVNEYLNLLRFNRGLVSKSNYSSLGLRDIYSVTPPPRFIKPSVIRTIVRAITLNKRVEIEYQSLDHPEPEIRVIAPHSLIECPLQWSVRAYCEKHKDYRDFILSRIGEQPDLMDSTPNPMKDDVHWCHSFELVLQASPLLTRAQQALIERDHAMTDGELIITTRLSLLSSMLSALGFTLSNLNAEFSTSQYLSIKNSNAVKEALVNMEQSLF